MLRKIGPLALAAVIALAMAAPSYAAPPTGKSEKEKSELSEKDKKPGQECAKFKKDSAAHKECIAKEAHEGKTPGAKDKAKGKS